MAWSQSVQSAQKTSPNTTQAGQLRAAAKPSKAAIAGKPGKVAKSGKAEKASKAALVAGAVAGVTAVSAASAAKAEAKPVAPLQDGQAETRLLEVYQRISQGDQRQALTQAEALVRDYPDFQLAHLVLGDLLSARSRSVARVGDVPGAERSNSSTVTTSLQQLRDESERRLQAQRHRPPENTVPAQFLMLSERSRHAVAVDASRSRLYLFENTAKGMRLVADYYASVGKLGIGKDVEGDQRTPLGVYFMTSRLDRTTLRDFYGAGALPINYPNPLDQVRGKTGKGIWVHGTPPNQFSRAPLATDGCVAIANPDLERLMRTVEPRSTPVIIAPELQWVAPGSVETERREFDTLLEAWSKAKSDGDMARLQRFYAPDFKSASQHPAERWLMALMPSEEQRGREVQLKDKSYLRWKDTDDTMVVTFGEVAVGARTGTTRRQYWIRRGTQWQIFYEGVIR
ncbi:MAG: L,D-transpeptidase family protein [Burkholderiaceae bacterium]|nr:L,D-transpeptidase family protein [Burkholderiaceae bacterium]